MREMVFAFLALLASVSTASRVRHPRAKESFGSHDLESQPPAEMTKSTERLSSTKVLELLLSDKEIASAFGVTPLTLANKRPDLEKGARFSHAQTLMHSGRGSFGMQNQRNSRVSNVSMQGGNDLAGAAAMATVTEVIKDVSKSVGEDVDAPTIDMTFVSMASDRDSLVDEDGLPTKYNKDAIRKYWEDQGGALQARWLEFLGTSVPFITRVAGLLLQNSGKMEALEREAPSLAKQAREGMEQLGPTFVKLGQTLSVRPDVLPQDALNELAVLQDNVEGYENSIAYAVIEKEYGRPLKEIFSEIADEPVAAASLAQVYKATLRETGEEVAVKVQRPGIRALVSKDLYVLRRAAAIYQNLFDRFVPNQRTNYVALLDEWAIGFYTELDFTNEGDNMNKMRTLLADKGVKNVMVPKVYDQYTTGKVLVSQWIDGTKLSECEPEQIKELIAIGQECFLVQLLQCGFFHSDPHPGNLLRLNDQSGQAKMALIDFGLVANVRQPDIDAIISAIIHLANKDYASLVDDFIGLKILPADCDRQTIIPLMDKALTPYVKGGGAKVYAEEVSNMYGVQEDAVGGFQAITQDFLTVLNDVPFSIPPYFALLARAIVTLEGVALTADPDYGLIIEAYPFVARKLLAEGRAEIQTVLQEILYQDGGTFTATRLASLLNSAAGNVAKEDGAVFASLDSVPEDGLSLNQTVKFLLSDDAAAVRKLLTNEGKTAVDLLLRQALRKGIPQVASRVPSLPSLPGLGAPPQQMEIPGPIILPALGDEPARPLFTSPQELMDHLAPKLTREEELYAISLVDLVRSSLGDDAAAVAAGDSVTDPLAAIRVLLNAFDTLEDAGSDIGPLADLPPQLLPLLRQGRDFLASVVPDRQGASGSAVSSASDDEIAELSELLLDLTEEERTRLTEVVGVISEAQLKTIGERSKNLQSSTPAFFMNTN